MSELKKKQFIDFSKWFYKGKNSFWFGKHHSKATKKKMSLSHKGKSRSEETKRKIRKTLKGLYLGEKAPNWKGGIRKSNGRIFIYKPEHPHADKQGYILQSHLIMEQTLERYLTPEEVVHHKNGKKDDDKPENLGLFESVGKHSAFHGQQRNIKEILRRQNNDYIHF